VLEWGVAGAALAGPESGDLEVVAPFDGGALCAVIDGLGHGAEAAEAARAAASLLAEHAGEPVTDLIHRCHAAIRGTRGAVMSLAAFDVTRASMTWAGVGNVEAVLFSADPSGQRRGDLMTRGGVVGYQIPPIRAVTLPVVPGDTLVMATDGLRSGFECGPLLPGAPDEIAARLFRDWARGTDDALVLVARYSPAETA
jgi:serine phosphatase RsbU (regulator of sigma subunit)